MVGVGLTRDQIQSGVNFLQVTARLKPGTSFRHADTEVRRPTDGGYRWRHNLDACRDELPALGLDERFGRLWDFYLAYCEAGFDERDITVVQLVLAGPGWSGRQIPSLRTNRGHRPPP